MPPTDFEEIAQLQQTAGAPAALERLADTLKASGQYHKLFDARLLKRKHELGLPLARPASLQDIPDDKRKQVEEAYVAAAREAGELLLAAGDIPAAWMYLQVIREPQKVAAAIEAIPVSGDFDEQSERIMQIALYQGVHPPQGVKMMLKSHGTCSTITAVDQAMQSLSTEQRRACAQVLVRSLYDDLTDSVRRHVLERVPDVAPDASLRELLAGRDWLFEGGGYHIDVSHLNSVTRFARALDASAPELDVALQMAEYGAHLDGQLQYGGEPPFQEFYAAHIQFFRVLLGRDVAAALQYFRDQLAAEPDEQDKPLIAYVLVDLLLRAADSGHATADSVRWKNEAVEHAAKYLTQLGDEAAFSFAELCVEAGRLDVLRRVSRERGDLVSFAAALVQESPAAGD